MRRTRISLASSPRNQGKQKHSSQVGGEGGHRFGNFQNYYSFHPTGERMKLLGETDGILDYIANDWKSMQPTEGKSDPDNPAKVNDGELAPATKKPRLDIQPDETTDRLPPFQFHYLDVGCNEGDLTMEVAKAITSRLVALTVKKTNAKPEVLGYAPSFRMNVHGCDIDPELIYRAQRKNLPADDKTISTNGESDAWIWPVFQVVDVLSDGNMNEAQIYHLTSIFSTTMWVHIHGGDDGLRRVLGSLCRKTKHYLIVEPQPSKCYRSAMNRLRKMGLPELDVSSERLKLRPRIEEEIDSILKENCFARVVHNKSTSSQEAGSSKTKWKRSIKLYQRIAQGGPHHEVEIESGG